MYQKLCFLILPFLFLQLSAQSFKVIPLGVKGGSDESNLSAYLVAPFNSSDFICLDAGTVHTGVEKAVKASLFKTSAERAIKNNIKGYCISHPHLDHLAGLIINSPDDTAKNIYGLPFCLDVIKDKYFTWKSWANFADQGDKPALNKYHYTYLKEGEEIALEQTQMRVKAFALSHSSPYQSTAFLIQSNDNYVLYLGDTGADETEKSDRLNFLWEAISPLIKTKKLKGIFIEVSFPNQQPAKQLFGHLTPALLMQEMENLARLTGKEAMRGFKVLITHIKPAGNHSAEIKRQLQQSNKLQLQLVYPQQAQLLKL
ncbi:MBL fold metallo-hydrolase [Segetibacter aerophilus]|uniref:3',5'-cyclic-nucleotide phosphodiesterase n=1 Tax=Segetibacter aerophilus TaxID=670293 RepID=A0A512BA02_9BACT|nr:3',5'-cyclic-nucleotide phosphodiesterase [Segetibacter aerophilus]GEO08791.1 3',5'-cyclic-nucleotide phosphodiesterase [Segetibacter aerophilus]